MKQPGKETPDLSWEAGDVERVSSTQATSYIVCPNFVAHGGAQVRCKWLDDTARVVLRFRGREQRERHEKTFCKARYGYCEVYRMVQQYEDEDEKENEK